MMPSTCFEPEGALSRRRLYINLWCSVLHTIMSSLLVGRSEFYFTMHGLKTLKREMSSYTLKVKVTLVQALKLCTGRTAHRGSRGIALPFHDHDTRRR